MPNLQGEAASALAHRMTREGPLVTFGEAPPPRPPAVQEEDELPFLLERTDGSGKKTQAASRPGQHRFSFRVFRRYGPCCAICDVAAMGAPGRRTPARL